MRLRSSARAELNRLVSQSSTEEKTALSYEEKEPPDNPRVPVIEGSRQTALRISRLPKQLFSRLDSAFISVAWCVFLLYHITSYASLVSGSGS